MGKICLTRGIFLYLRFLSIPMWLWLKFTIAFIVVTVISLAIRKIPNKRVRLIVKIVWIVLLILLFVLYSIEFFRPIEWSIEAVP